MNGYGWNGNGNYNNGFQSNWNRYGTNNNGYGYNGNYNFNNNIGPYQNLYQNGGYYNNNQNNFGPYQNNYQNGGYYNNGNNWNNNQNWNNNNSYNNNAFALPSQSFVFIILSTRNEEKRSRQSKAYSNNHAIFVCIFILKDIYCCIRQQKK